MGVVSALKAMVWSNVGPMCGVAAVGWPSAAPAAEFEAAPDQAANGSAKAATATI
jgi:hypothetical protein